MSSPCTVATICLPLMQPCHTYGHVIPVVNLRSLSVEVNSSSQCCAASRVPTSCIATARTCVRHLPGNPLAADRRILFFVLERGSTPCARRPMPQPFLSDSTAFIASSGGVDAYNSGVACVLHSFATHLARTLGSPGCPLPVSAQPVLMGALPVSRKHNSLGTPMYILWRRMYSTSSRLALAHSSGSTRPSCHPNAIPSHKLSSSCSS